ncbi:hypothetical protein SCALM49S_08697 [Streptomyces californicus]
MLRHGLEHGVAPDDSLTPRKAAARIVRLGRLDTTAAEAVHRIAGSVEQVLYAPEPRPAAGAADDALAVRAGLEAAAGRGARLRAMFCHDRPSGWCGRSPTAVRRSPSAGRPARGPAAGRPGCAASHASTADAAHGSRPVGAAGRPVGRRASRAGRGTAVAVAARGPQPLWGLSPQLWGLRATELRLRLCGP